MKASPRAILQDRTPDAIAGFSENLVFIYLPVDWHSSWVLLNTGPFKRLTWRHSCTGKGVAQNNPVGSRTGTKRSNQYGEIVPDGL